MARPMPRLEPVTIAVLLGGISGWEVGVQLPYLTHPIAIEFERSC